MLIDLLFVALKIATAVTALWLTKLYFFPFYIPGIPIRRANHWFFGYSNGIPSKKGKFDSHLSTLEEVEKTGKIFQYYHLGRHRVFISDKYIAKFAIEHINGKGFYHRGNENINHPNIFNLNTGPEWKIRRNAFRQSFSMIYLKTFQEQLKLLTAKLIAALKKCAQEKTMVEMDKIFGQLTVDVICSVAFQYDLHAMEDSVTSQELHEAIRAQFETSWIGLLPLVEYFYHLPIPVVSKLREAQRKVKSFCLRLWKHISKLHSEGLLKKESVGYALLEFSKLDGVTEDDVCSEILIMFIAGHETTAHTLSFFIYALTTHPEIQSKCHAAMDQNGASSTSHNVANADPDGGHSVTSLLPVYVEAVLKESMRKYPTVGKGAFRLVQDQQGVTIPLSVLNRYDTTLHAKNSLEFTHPVTIPHNTWIQINTYNLHNCKLNWGERVNEFVPERFLPAGHYSGDISNGSSCSNNPLSSPAIYGGGGAESGDLIFMPFAFGMRNCIGMNLAMMEIRLTLSEILKTFSFTLADESMKDERIAYEMLLTSRPHKKLPVFVQLQFKLSDSLYERERVQQIAPL